MKKKLILLLSKTFNWYFDFYTGRQERPVFFDVNTTCPELSVLENNCGVIRSELEVLMQQSGKIRKYHEVDTLQHEISAVKNPEKSWSVYMLYMMGIFSKDALEQCPQTCALLKQIPGIYQCFFSVLDAKKNIPRHNGAYRGYLRYHLGLKVPSQNPPYIIVRDEPYTWSEAKGVLFDDSWSHEVVNDCEEPRAVLVVDIYRPMPKIPDKVNRLLTTHLIKKFYAEKVIKKL
jgi:aspartyl/asparaginyl beta-hydroxylase (cupin superfamily)